MNKIPSVPKRPAITFSSHLTSLTSRYASDIANASQHEATINLFGQVMLPYQEILSLSVCVHSPKSITLLASFYGAGADQMIDEQAYKHLIQELAQDGFWIDGKSEFSDFSGTKTQQKMRGKNIVFELFYGLRTEAKVEN